MKRFFVKGGRVLSSAAASGLAGSVICLSAAVAQDSTAQRTQQPATVQRTSQAAQAQQPQAQQTRQANGTGTQAQPSSVQSSSAPAAGQAVQPNSATSQQAGLQAASQAAASHASAAAIAGQASQAAPGSSSASTATISQIPANQVQPTQYPLNQGYAVPVQPGIRTARVPTGSVAIPPVVTAPAIVPPVATVIPVAPGVRPPYAAGVGPGDANSAAVAGSGFGPGTSRGNHRCWYRYRRRGWWGRRSSRASRNGHGRQWVWRDRCSGGNRFDGGRTWSWCRGSCGRDRISRAADGNGRRRDALAWRGWGRGRWSWRHSQLSHGSRTAHGAAFDRARWTRTACGAAQSALSGDPLNNEPENGSW